MGDGLAECERTWDFEVRTIGVIAWRRAPMVCLNCVETSLPYYADR